MKQNMVIRQNPWLPVLLAALTLPMGACAVFNVRYRSWDRDIERDGDGVALFALPYTLGEGDTALLLVHGFGDSPQVWSKLAPELAERGYTVRAMRLPGWGEPPAVKRTVSREQGFEAIESEIEALREEHEQVVVLAHSMGGALTSWLAVHDRLDTDALVLYAPMFDISDERSPVLSTRQWFEVGDRILPRRMLVESLFPDHARVHPPRPRTLRDPFVPNHIYRLLYQTMDELREADARMDFPVHLVLPGEDRVVRNDTAKAWFEALTAPVKTLHIEEPAGHVLPLDINFSREADRIHLWIQRNVMQNTTHSPSQQHD
ncbi:MAG: alpha/beta fold hydrolase [Verrucomicrobia bacterium]|nr:alpha/beta fold hydrolase [Verrucomicrobiota bacterium]MCH8527866.1 alpha/beta hydrolase [Kiritimatiellia bacterium]